MTPEERALLIHLTFPTRNTDGEADAMEKFTAEQIRAAIAEEREACAKIVKEWYERGLSHDVTWSDEVWPDTDKIVAAILAHS